MIIQSVQTFGSLTIGDYYREATKRAIADVEAYSQKQLIGMDTEELIEYLTQEYSLSPLEIDDTREIEFDKVEKKEAFRTILDNVVYKETVVARLTIPLKPYPRIEGALEYMTNQHVL